MEITVNTTADTSQVMNDPLSKDNNNRFITVPLQPLN